MNSLVLLIITAVAFVFGYRFYSKLLGTGIFRLGDHYSTPATGRFDSEQGTAPNRHLIFGHHLAALAAGAAITGSVISVIWGWIPAFLWAVVATVTAAGTYGLGAIWLSLRFPGLDPAEIAARVLGPSAYGPFTLIALLLLLLMNAACATIAAQLFSAFPSAVLPFWGILTIALFLGYYLRGREAYEVVAASLIALTLSLMAVWLLGKFPLSLTGALNLESSDYYIALDATVVWVAILFTYGYHATRLPMWKLIRPRGFLTALLLGTTLLVFYTAVVIDHPNLVAPEFHKDPSIPHTIPWLFITLTTGAVAGFHLLIANGITARQIRRESDARYVGYGGALALGLLALSAIIIGGTGFPSEQDWTQRYASWDAFKDLHQAAVIYVDGFARFAAILGLDPATARTLAAVVVLGLLVATLEAGLRVQKQLLAGLAERYPSVMPGKEKLLIGLAAFLSAALTLHDGHGLGGLLLWPIFGATDLIFAVFGFVLLTLSLRQLERPVATVLLPLIFLLAAANWALTIQMIQWWSMNDWILFALGIILIIIELGVTLLVFNFLKSSPRPQLDSVP